jgi:hypothetical protein
MSVADVVLREAIECAVILAALALYLRLCLRARGLARWDR